MGSLVRRRRPWFQEDEPRVLIYGNRKSDDTVWAFTTETERRGAILALFHILDEDWEVYADLDQHDDDAQAVLPGFAPRNEQAEQRALLRAARTGDSDAAYNLLKRREDYQYEEWRILPINRVEAEVPR